MSDPFEFMTGLLLAMVRTSVLVSAIPTFKSSAGKAFLVPFPMAIGLCVEQASGVAGLPLAALFPLVVKEALLGAALGFMVSRVFIVMSTAGAVLDQQAGYTIGALFNPSLGHTAGPIETLYTQLLILILMTAGGGLFFPSTIMATYVAWPITTLWPSGASLDGFIHDLLTDGANSLIGMALQIATPILAMLMFSDLCVALLGRYASELSPMSMSLAIKAFLVCLMLVVTIDNQMDNMRHLIALLLRVT
ncbi:EscT/YscT/HrcT family type III secretion system export apparatus protein [Dyella nitratireducens]|uniref:Type III secretion protein T n=1 Tax=Dyella nitratireducens TaxID=1849580 RepID=A0ABQ1FN29_9GAMM|nr:flagellar biosynthetic protein FliR [Dyella nitratireducens]GGA23409.1 hypothetical protein GCM10010981_09660 [Dyella nitratireducens]GLQ43971.1 hypothetical protein GCM10007902_38210 [Dyella nitratireducens]